MPNEMIWSYFAHKIVYEMKFLTLFKDGFKINTYI